MFSTDFIFRQQENLVDNQKCQAGFRPLCNKIPFLYFLICLDHVRSKTIQIARKQAKMENLYVGTIKDKFLRTDFGGAADDPCTWVPCQVDTI